MSFTSVCIYIYIAIKITHTDFILGLYGTPQFICLKQAPLSRFLSANFLFIGCLSQTKDLNGRWMGLQIGRPLIYDIIQFSVQHRQSQHEAGHQTGHGGHQDEDRGFFTDNNPCEESQPGPHLLQINYKCQSPPNP